MNWQLCVKRSQLLYSFGGVHHVENHVIVFISFGSLEYLIKEKYSHEIICMHTSCSFPKSIKTSMYRNHYSDVIIRMMASQITGVSIVYSYVCSGSDQRKHQRSASLAFAKGIHRWPFHDVKRYHWLFQLCRHLALSTQHKDRFPGKEVAKTPIRWSLDNLMFTMAIS